jgi:sigma-B regulation protein RsbU (phosphoserine phosphatase)
MILGVADVESGRVVCGLAAHNQPAVVRASGSVVFGPVGGVPMGLHEGGAFGEWVVDLGAGDALVVYTDGVTEAMDPSDRMFGADALRGVLAAAARRSAGEIVAAVSSAVVGHAAGGEPSDDITILALRRRDA